MEIRQYVQANQDFQHQYKNEQSFGFKLNPFRRKTSAAIDDKILKIQEADNCFFVVPEGSSNKAFHRCFSKGLQGLVDEEK